MTRNVFQNTRPSFNFSGGSRNETILSHGGREGLRTSLSAGSITDLYGYSLEHLSVSTTALLISPSLSTTEDRQDFGKTPLLVGML